MAPPGPLTRQVPLPSCSTTTLSPPAAVRDPVPRVKVAGAGAAVPVATTVSSMRVRSWVRPTQRGAASRAGSAAPGEAPVK